MHEWKETFEFNYNTGLYDLGGNIHSLTTWIFEAGSFVPCGKISNGKHYSIITDHLGTPIEAYNQEGELIWEREQDLYGNSRQGFAKENFRCPFKYQGQYYDPEIELCYNRFRYYHPETGRYISQDPIGFLSGEPNFFAYVGDTNWWLDMLGLYNGEGERELGKYNSFFNHDLKPSEYKRSDGYQFSEANKALHERFQKDEKFAKMMNKKYPGIIEHVKPNKKGKYSRQSPPGTTWHHGNKPGRLELVDYLDHKTYHKIYHPDGYGGRKAWGGGNSYR